MAVDAKEVEAADADVPVAVDTTMEWTLRTRVEPLRHRNSISSEITGDRLFTICETTPVVDKDKDEDVGFIAEVEDPAADIKAVGEL